MRRGRAGRPRRPHSAGTGRPARRWGAGGRGAGRPLPGESSRDQPPPAGAARGGPGAGADRGESAALRTGSGAPAGARRLAGALPRPVGPALGRTGHRDRPRPAGTSERRAAMTEDLDTRRGVVTIEDDGRQRLEFRRSWPDPIDDVWSALTEPDRLARWIGVYEGERRVGGTGTFAM